MKVISKSKICVLVLALLASHCTSPIPRPFLKGSKTNTGDLDGGESDGTSGGNHPATGGKTTPVDPKALIGNLNKILAPENPECATAPSIELANPQLRLLTKVEYQNTIQDLFGLSKNYSSQFPVEKKILGFKNNAQTNLVSVEHLEAYLSASSEIAKDILSSRFQEVFGCAPNAGDSCAQAIIQNMAPKIWRRPLSKDEGTRLFAAYKANAGTSVNSGFEVLIRILLSSPHFLYRSEIGNAGNLTAHELAHALSYFFWSSVPDDTLRRLADSSEILKNSVLLSEASRLLKSPKSKFGMNQFAESYLYYNRFANITKDQAKFPHYNPAIRDAMLKEAEDTFDFLIRGKNATFEDLYSNDFTVGNQQLANFYSAAPSNENGTETISFASQKRRGILSLGAVLAGLSNGVDPNPISRGVFVREHMLCEILPFPTDLKIEPLPVIPGATMRERFAIHTKSASCKACHERIDGVGFGMDDYDAVGLPRSMDNGKPVDSNGNIFDLDGKNQSFSGLDGITGLLKNSERAKRCFVLQAFRESSGRFETKGDICAIRAIADDFVKKDQPIAELLIRIITDPNFNKRKGL